MTGNEKGDGNGIIPGADSMYIVRGHHLTSNKLMKLHASSWNYSTWNLGNLGQPWVTLG